MSTARTAAFRRAAAPDLADVSIAAPAHGDDARWQLRPGELVRVGTSPDNQLVLAGDTISRVHASLEHVGRGVRVRDLGSRNGTWVRGLRVHDVVVEPTCELCLGRATLTLEPVTGELDRLGPFVGSSPALRRLIGRARRIAASDAVVLIEGETGTGKSLLARALHELGGRRAGPLVVVDCAAIAPTLIEDELFGHVAGAYTGADHDRAGAFEAAAGGTIFLDEIGELSPELQPKLLRVLEERVVRRLGATAPVAVDARVVSATNRELAAEVRAGRFRADLYYRLDVVRLRIPSLRERPDDVPALIAGFIDDLARRGLSAPIGPDDVERMQRLPWHGNVRELRTAVERAAVLGDRAALLGGIEPGASDPPGALPDFKLAKQQALDDFERGYLGALLRRCGSNLAAAARSAGLDRNHLRLLVQRHGLA